VLVLNPSPQPQCKCIAVGGCLEKVFRSWWAIRTRTLQLVGFPKKHFAVGGFLLGGIVELLVKWLGLVATDETQCCTVVTHSRFHSRNLCRSFFYRGEQGSVWRQKSTSYHPSTRKLAHEYIFVATELKTEEETVTKCCIELYETPHYSTQQTVLYCVEGVVEQLRGKVTHDLKRTSINVLHSTEANIFTFPNPPLQFSSHEGKKIQPGTAFYFHFSFDSTN